MGNWAFVFIHGPKHDGAGEEGRRFTWPQPIVFFCSFICVVWNFFFNPEAYKKSCYALRRTIKQAKRQYWTKMESYYTCSDAHRMWQGLQTITDYKGKHSRKLPSNTSLPYEQNNFYAPFEASNTETCMSASAVQDDCMITLSAAKVTSLCNWILDFLTGCPQVIRVSNNTSAMLILNTGPLRGAYSVPSCTSCSVMTARPGTLQHHH